MGFRGEALASIASIARVKLSSKPADQEYAMLLTSDENGVKTKLCARSQGTTVDVLDLFYNTPVRKKFLKSEKMEYSAIDDVVKRFALSAPHIAITVWHNASQQYFLPAAHCARTHLLRVQKILGKSFVEHAIFIDVSTGDLHIKGWISSAKYQRSQNNKQWVYLNHRMVKDKLIDNALRQAYLDLLHPGRYPACVLYLSLPTDVVDVNVHPTKHEVRFQDPRLVHDVIRHQLSTALSSVEDQLDEIHPELMSNRNHLPVYDSNVSYHNQSWLTLNMHFAVISLPDSLGDKSAYLVDVPRVLKHQYTDWLAESEFPWAARPLLVPITYVLTSVVHKRLVNCIDLFENLGVKVESMGTDTIAVRTLPVVLPLLDLQQVFSRLDNNSVWDVDTLSMLFFNCIQCDILQWDAEQRIALTDYLSCMPHSIELYGCLRLDAERCQALYAE